MNTEYPLGVDCVWIAADAAGCLGAFVTGGVGPIPRLVLDAKDIAVQDIEEHICELPKRCNMSLLVIIPRPDDFIAMAERGFFVYDWTDVHRTSGELIHVYELMAVPESPITITGLPPDIRELVADIKLNIVYAADRKTIDIQALLECICENKVS